MHNMKPMLSGKVDLKKQKYPCWASPKLDGIRSITKDYGLLSRTLKAIPNQHVQSVFRSLPAGIDGELMVGQPNAKDVYNKTQSAVMSKDGLPEIGFYAFDMWNMGPIPYSGRYHHLRELVSHYAPAIPIHLLTQSEIHDEEQLLAYEAWAIDAGFEGIMVRDPDGFYKYGRSTTNEGILLKMKRYSDAEAVIVGMTEMMHNDNELTTDNLGHAKRAHNQENLRPAGVMGNLVVRDRATGVDFEIGTGFTAEDREEFWRYQSKYMGKTVTYKYFAHGVKDRPRHPVYKGLRDPRDM